MRESMWKLLVCCLTRGKSLIITGYVLSHFSRVQVCDPVDCSPPGSPVPGILQARILECVAMPSSRGSSSPRGWTCGFLHLPALAGGFFTTSATWKAPIIPSHGYYHPNCTCINKAGNCSSCTAKLGGAHVGFSSGVLSLVRLVNSEALAPSSFPYSWAITSTDQWNWQCPILWAPAMCLELSVLRRAVCFNWLEWAIQLWEEWEMMIRTGI